MKSVHLIQDEHPCSQHQEIEELFRVANDALYSMGPAQLALRRRIVDLS